MPEPSNLKALQDRVHQLEEELVQFKLSNENLLSHAENCRLLFENNPHPMWVYDLETLRFLTVNDAAIRNYGYSREEFLSMTIKDIRPPEDIPRLLENVSAVTEGFDAAGDWRHIKKDGTVIDVEITSHTLTFEGRKAELVLACDITEKKRTMESIRRKNAYLTALHETTLGLISRLELDELLKDIVVRAGNLIGTDQGYIFLYDKSSDELIIRVGIGKFEKLTDFRMKPGEGLSGKVWQAGQPFKIEDYSQWSGRHPDARFDTLGTDLAIPLKTGDHIMGVIGLCSFDKATRFGETEMGALSQFAELASIALENARLHSDLHRELENRLKAEEALTISQEALMTVLDGIDATIYVADLETYEILFMNKHMSDAFGRNLVGETCWKVFRGETKPCPHCTNKQLLDKSGNPTGVVVWEGKNPVLKKWYLNYDRAVKWIDGRLVRLQIATDITQIKVLEAERHQMENQLQQVQKMEALGTLAGGIAHDFNNLLMGIQGRTSLILTDTAGEPFRDHLKGIEEYVRTASQLIQQLLGFARGGKYEVQITDINALIRNNVNMFGRTRKEINIHTKFQNDIRAVEVDRSQIEQVLLNLYVNAWQAMPSGGHLYLSTENVVLEPKFVDPYGVAAGPYVKISITDTGIGMDQSTQERIFDPFFTTKEKERGTGLGLSSAYGIIKNHNGIICVRSEQGRGSTFVIYLPATGKKVAVEKESPEELLIGRGMVLLIDDEAMIIEVGSLMLQKMGYETLVATSGKEAIGMYGKHGPRIDLVILDMIMPGMNGGEIYDRLRAMNSNLKAILTSGYSIDGEAQNILDRGCNGFIQKPFKMEQLSRKIREVLD